MCRAPTFLDLAGIKIPALVDGRSIAPLLRGDGELGAGRVSGWRTSFLIEHYALADCTAAVFTAFSNV